MTVRRPLLAVCMLLAWVGGGTAFESGTCIGSGGMPCTSGPDEARHPWRAPVDEHRTLWEMTMPLAGLPATTMALSPFTLRLYTAADTISIGGAPQPSIAPVEFADAVKALDRPAPNTIGEFTQIPDWSYALWDWALGNERCPDVIVGTPTTDPNACHNYRWHLGPVNSNHFLPQARDYFEHYHGLAIARAQACDAIERRMGAARSRYHDYLVACEREALVLEAIGHHFLQDAWSMGHTWERWGSAEPTDWNTTWKPVAVGALSGIIHGARAVLQGTGPWAGSDVADPMCSPTDGVEYRTSPLLPSTITPGAGDDYLYRLMGEAQFVPQRSALLACTAASVREVYAQLAEPELGALGPADGSLSLPDSLDRCFRARATNQALALGAAIDSDNPSSGHSHVPLTPDLATLAELHFASPEVAATYDAVLLESGLADVMAEVEYWAKIAPQGTQLASGGIPPFLGTAVNHRFAGKLASYADPALPWPTRPRSTPDPSPHATAIARAFHRAHFDDWCAAMDADYLHTLRQRVAEAVGGGDPETIAVKTEICTEFAARHARPWSADAPRNESLCSYTVDDPNAVATLDRFAADAAQAAAAWCACGNGRVDAGEDCDLSAPHGDGICPGRCLPVDYAKKVGTHRVNDGCRCVPCQ